MVCGVCGKLMSEGFQPLDVIRSSYGMQRKRLDFGREIAAETLFYEQPPLVSKIAWACAVYSMVPYIGVIFIPFAIIIGSCDYFAAQRDGRKSDQRAALITLTVSSLLLAAQIILWWLLYLIPELAR